MKRRSYAGGEHPVWMQVTHGLHDIRRPLYRTPTAFPIPCIALPNVACMMPY